MMTMTQWRNVREDSILAVQFRLITFLFASNFKSIRACWRHNDVTVERQCANLFYFRKQKIRFEFKQRRSTLMYSRRQQSCASLGLHVQSSEIESIRTCVTQETSTPPPVSCQCPKKISQTKDGFKWRHFRFQLTCVHIRFSNLAVQISEQPRKARMTSSFDCDVDIFWIFDNRKISLLKIQKLPSSMVQRWRHERARFWTTIA